MKVEIQKAIKESIISYFIADIIETALKGETIEGTYKEIQALKFNKKMVKVGRGGSHIWVKDHHDKRILLITKN
jgi:hypothetical protein